MAKVTNLQIIRQEGTDNTYFATWDFTPPASSSAASSSVIAGCTVSIKSGATYYNGVDIPDAVNSRQFKVKSIGPQADRAVLGGSTDGQYKDINSPVKISNLTVVSGGGNPSSTPANTLDHYVTTWHYNTGQTNKDGTNIWFEGGSQDVTSRQSQTYSPPENATHIRIRVKPVSKKYKVKSGDSEVEKSYWSGENVYQWFGLSAAPPAKPSAPSVTVEGYTLTATIDNVTDARTDKIQFQVYNNNTNETSGTVTVQTCRAIYTCTLQAGGKYRVRCRAVNDTGGTQVYSDWSDFSGEQLSPPAAVTNVKCSADSETMFKLTWDASNSATGYEIQYTTKSKYFDTSSEVQSTSISKGDTTTAYISVESGRTWYFRIGAKNASGEVAAWSDIVSGVIGTKPEPPTTWSLTTNVIRGDDITLYWVHNSEDSSNMTEAEIELSLGINNDLIRVDGTTKEDEDEPIYSYKFNTNSYPNVSEIGWCVRTKGIVDEYSDWSTMRTINVYDRPTVSLSLSTTDGGGHYVKTDNSMDVYSSYDVIEGVYTATKEQVCYSEDLAGQGYSGYFCIVDGSWYEVRFASAGEQLTAFPFSIKAITGPITQKPVSYHVSIKNRETYESVDVVGSAVLIGSNTELYSKIFITSDQELSLDLSAGDVHLENGQTYDITVTVSMNSGLVATATESFTVNWGEYSYIPDASVGIDMETLSAYITPYCMDANGNMPTDATLAVYRREYNGTFTAIALGIANNGVETIVDPHPSLDYARYRIVAQSSVSGAISYEDLPGHPINEPSIVIQWDEKWNDFNYVEDDPAETPPWSGSMLRFPYNVDVAEKYDPDVALVNYIGREHPVSYFGTHRGESASWSTTIPATDKDTIYALRRLAAWRGNVYVREPSGTGYWAVVKVTFPQKHLDLTIPITFDITRVEGGI